MTGLLPMTTWYGGHPVIVSKIFFVLSASFSGVSL